MSDVCDLNDNALAKAWETAGRIADEQLRVCTRLERRRRLLINLDEEVEDMPGLDYGIDDQIPPDPVVL
jgi:hypothetical protein